MLFCVIITVCPQSQTDCVGIWKSFNITLSGTTLNHFIMEQQTELELQAAAFRRLVSHLREHTDVQNIDLMNLAGFCRNCLSKWYLAAAEEKGLDMDYEKAREIIYGMPYSEWKSRYQSEASEQQKQKFNETIQQQDQ